MSAIGKVLIGLVAAYAVLVLLVFLGQRKLMYYPTTQRVTPADAGLHAVDEVIVEIDNGWQLYSWYAAARPGRPTILLFHGNAGAVSHRAYRFAEFRAHGYGLFIAGYPGYGGSDGAPSERAFLAAAHAAYGYLTGQGTDPRDIVIYGASIGSAVAVQLAAAVEARALVLEAPMASAVHVASMHYPYLPVSWLLKDRYLSDEHIGSIEMPLLIVHGSDDQVVPISSGRRLYDAAVGPKLFKEVAGAGHNDLALHAVSDIVRRFLGA